MRQLLHDHCYWVNIASDVEDYCKKGKWCNIAKPPEFKYQGPAGMLLAMKPFDLLSMDFTELENDRKEFQYLLVMTYFYNIYCGCSN